MGACVARRAGHAGVMTRSMKMRKIVHDEPEPSDGRRTLVKRLWPRGTSKDGVDVWTKEMGAETAPYPWFVRVRSRADPDRGGPCEQRPTASPVTWPETPSTLIYSPFHPETLPSKSLGRYGMASPP